MAGERIFLAGIVLLVLAAGVVACLGPEERLAFLLYDDAYYYLGVARNLAAGAGSTFDGINPTNGYHPLWCWLLVPVFRLATDTGNALRLAGGLWFALAAAAPVVLWRALRSRTGATGACLAAALFGLQPLLPPGLARANGLETPLLAVCIGGFLIAWESLWDRAPGVPGHPPSPAPSPVALFGLGLGLGVVILARFDAGLLAVAAAVLAAAALLARVGLVGAVTRLAFLTAGAVLVAGPSLAWNQVRFGNPMPVSGRIVRVYASLKGAGGEAPAGVMQPASLIAHAAESFQSIALVFSRAAVEGLPGATPLLRHGRVLLIVFFAWVACCFAVALRSRGRPVTSYSARGAAERRPRPILTDPLLLLALFAVLHAASYAGWLWAPDETSYRLYYFLPLAMLGTASVGSAVGPLLERAAGPWPRAALGAALLVLLGWRMLTQQAAALPDAGTGSSSAFGAVGTNGAGAAAAAESAAPVASRHIYGWIRRELPAGAVLGAPDAGKLGYFCGHPVVNLDGLANDDRFVHAVETGTEDEYLLHSPIRFVLVDRPWLFGFDPAKPDVRPPRLAGLGETLFRLAQRPGIRLRDVPGPPPDWVVVEIVRP